MSPNFFTSKIILKSFIKLFIKSSYKIIFKKPVSLKPGDFCIKQMLSITGEFLKSVDNILEEVKIVLSDISKVFDNDWHKGLNCNLKRNGIFGELLRIILVFKQWETKNSA